MATEHTLPMGLDADAISKTAASMVRRNPRPRLDLRDLPGLRQQIDNMRGHLADHERAVESLRPGVHELERELEAHKKAHDHLAREFKELNIYDAGEADRLRQKIERLQDDLASAKERLDRNARIAAGWRKSIAEWPFHAELAELKAADALLDRAVEGR